MWGLNADMSKRLVSRTKTKIELKASAFFTDRHRLDLEEMKVSVETSTRAANGELESHRTEGKFGEPFLTLDMTKKADEGKR